MNDPELSRWRWLGLIVCAPVVLLLWLNPGVLALGLLGVAHAVGHALVARALGVRHRLQLGFGPRLAWLGSDEQKLDLAPLPGATTRVDLDGASAGSVFTVLVAGPVASSFVGGGLAVLLFTVSLWGTTRPAPVVGSLDLEGEGARAGIQVGDRIEKVDGRPVESWDEVARGLADGGEVVLEDGRTVLLEADPGLHAMRRAAVVAVDPTGTWAQAGARTGDRVVSVETWDELAPKLGEELTVDVLRPDGQVTLQISSGPAGVELADRVLGGVMRGSAADEAGLRAGDKLLTVNGRPLADWNSLRSRVAEQDELVVTFERDGAVHDVTIVPHVVRRDGQERRLLGVERMPGLYLNGLPGPTMQLPDAVAGALSQSWTATTTMLRALAAMVSTQPRASSLGGPVYVFAPEPAGSLLRVAAVVLLNAMLGLTLYNLMPLPGSDLLTGLDQVAHRRFGRHLPLRLYGWILGGLLGLLFLLVLVMDAMRAIG